MCHHYINVSYEKVLTHSESVTKSVMLCLIIVAGKVFETRTQHCMQGPISFEIFV